MYCLIALISLYAAVRAEQVYRHQNKILAEQRHLIVENNKRIEETKATQSAIQKSRIKSCEDTYKANTLVLNVFFKGRRFPPEAQKQINKAYAAWDPKKCPTQTAVHKER